MQGERRERFHEICEWAEDEENANRFAELAAEINAILSEESSALKERPPSRFKARPGPLVLYITSSRVRATTYFPPHL
jgi:hypothetical protein